MQETYNTEVKLSERFSIEKQISNLNNQVETLIHLYFESADDIIIQSVGINRMSYQVKLKDYSLEISTIGGNNKTYVENRLVDNYSWSLQADATIPALSRVAKIQKIAKQACCLLGILFLGILYFLIAKYTGYVLIGKGFVILLIVGGYFGGICLGIIVSKIITHISNSLLDRNKNIQHNFNVWTKLREQFEKL